MKIIEVSLRGDRNLTLSNLLQKISSILGTYYFELRRRFKDPKQAVLALWGNSVANKDYSLVSSLVELKELSKLVSRTNSYYEEEKREEAPGNIMREYYEILLKLAPLDYLVARQMERLKHNSFIIEEALKEIILLNSQGLTESFSIKHILEFWHDARRKIDDDNQRYEFDYLIDSLPFPELKWLLSVEKYFSRVDKKKWDPDALSSVTGAFMKERTLLKSLVESIFDEKGNFRKDANLKGRSEVISYPTQEPLFYFKKYPELPGYENASTLFMRALGLAHLPYHDLLIMGPSGNKFPVLLSQAVQGNPLYRVWGENNVLGGLDPHHTFLQILCAMILNPEDGKEDNFILTKDRKYLIPIDNDHIFLPGTIRDEKKFWNEFSIYATLQTKTLLFCLDEMHRTIPESVQEIFKTIDFDSFLIKWINEIVNTQQRFENLVPEHEELRRYIDQGTVIGITFYKPFIDHMYWKCHRIKQMFQITSGLTPFDILRMVEPFIAKHYHDAFSQGDTLKERFEFVMKELYPKVTTGEPRQSVINTKEMMSILKITEKEMRANPTFERIGPLNFYEYLTHLIQQKKKKDNSEEKDEKFFFDFEDKKKDRDFLVRELKNFAADPKSNLCIKGDPFSSSSHDISLLFSQSFKRGTTIKFLSFQNLHMLNKEIIKILIHECPNLEFLNLNGCSRLKKLHAKTGEWRFLTRLEAFNCNNLKNIDLHSPISILRAERWGTQIAISLPQSNYDSVDLLLQVGPWELVSNKTTQLTIQSRERILTEEQMMAELGEYQDTFYINIGAFSSYGLAPFLNSKWVQSMCKSHFEFEVTDEQLQSLKMAKVSFGCQDIRVSSQNRDFGRRIVRTILFPELQVLILKNVDIKLKDMGFISKESCWPNLRVLDISENQLTNEGLEMLVEPHWLNLEQLYLQATKITGKGIKYIKTKSNWPKLKILNISQNEILDEGLELLISMNWANLEQIYLMRTQITGKDVGIMTSQANNWENLRIIDVSDNDINDDGVGFLTTPRWTKLDQLLMERLKITNKGIKEFVLTNNWSDLRVLNISHNDIKDEGVESLAVAHWPRLEQLYLKNIGIQEKGVQLFITTADFPHLRILDLCKNRFGDHGIELLTSQKWPDLEQLLVSNTMMTKAGLKMLIQNSSWPELETLNISENSLSDEGLDYIFSAPWPKLKQAYLDSIGLTQTGIENMSRRIQWSCLQVLSLSHNMINDKGLEYLLSIDFPLLEEIYLRKIGITEQGLQLLAFHPHWKDIKVIDLSENNFGDQGLEFLTLKEWNKLEKLLIGDTGITGRGVTAISNTLAWQNFQLMDASDNNIIIEEVTFLYPVAWRLTV